MSECWEWASQTLTLVRDFRLNMYVRLHLCQADSKNLPWFSRTTLSNFTWCIGCPKQFQEYFVRLFDSDKTRCPKTHANILNAIGVCAALQVQVCCILISLFYLRKLPTLFQVWKPEDFGKGELDEHRVSESAHNSIAGTRMMWTDAHSQWLSRSRYYPTYQELPCFGT